MKDVTRVTLLLILFCGTASTAFGQASTVVSSATGFACQGSFGPPMGATFLTSGAPYSAVQESSSVQTLADGTHITHKPMTEKIYHDAEGRTRTERVFCRGPEGIEATVIEIRDPVAGYSYILDQQNQVAHRFALQVPKRMEPVRTANPANAARPVLNSETPQQQPARPTATTESLGTQTMEGLLVEGTRTTRIFPEGFADNDRPITVVSEVWRSSELKVIVLSKTNDPRNGEMTTRLTNIDLSNPVFSLFQPPPDYKVVDEADRVTLTYTRP
jgi:hypothetical protein